MVISVALGMMIAALVVFPVLKIIGKEIFSVIFKSTVRQIGQNVQLTEHSNSADLLPFVSEQLLFPQYQAVEFTNPSSNNPANSQPAGKSGNEGFNKFPAVIPMDPPENFPPSDSNIPLNSLKIDENYLRF